MSKSLTTHKFHFFFLIPIFVTFAFLWLSAFIVGVLLGKSEADMNDEIQQTLNGIGITNVVHVKRMAIDVKKALQAPERPHNEVVMKPPRQVLQELFMIQGHPLDPADRSSHVAFVAKVIENFSDVQTCCVDEGFHFAVFISHRVNPNRDSAQTQGVKCFWDN